MWFNPKFKFYVISKVELKESLVVCCLVAKLCLTHCEPLDCRMPGFPVLHTLPEFTQTHVHQVGDAIQPSHPLLLSSPLALSLVIQWVGSSHQVTKVLALQLQHQSFQRAFRVDFLWDWLVWSSCSPKFFRGSSSASQKRINKKEYFFFNYLTQVFSF